MRRGRRAAAAALAVITALAGGVVTGTPVYALDNDTESRINEIIAEAESRIEEAISQAQAEIGEAEIPFALPEAESVPSAGAAEEAEEPAEEETAALVPEGGGDVAVSRIRFAEDYREVYDAVMSAGGGHYYYEDVYMVEDAAEDIMYDNSTGVAGAVAKADTVPAAEMDTGAGESYSETNVRTEGVDEADVVKTDGRNIYILKEHRDLVIVKAGEGLKVLSSVHPGDVLGKEMPGAEEFFVNGSLLHVICSGRKESEDSPYFYGNDANDCVTTLVTYDISDPGHPVLTGTVEQSGLYTQARMYGGMLYLFSRWYPMVRSTYEESDMVPSVGGADASADHVCIPGIVTNNDYMIATSVDPGAPGKVRDYKILLSGAEQLYVSAESFYAVNVDYDTYNPRTEIVKFSFDGGEISGVAAGRLRGEVNDTFSIDEYNGYLRVLTTYEGSVRGEVLEFLSDIFGFDYYDEDRWVRHNAIYVLDTGMQRVGCLLDLAEGEEIKSARFMGDTGYFVTFRNTDPLFTVDLKDPAHPVITGEVKLPGFSAYLHPFGENLLLGLGYEANEQTGSTTGLKLSLFDTSDPTDVREISRSVIDRITWCPALDNYKSIFADAGKRLTGFFVEDHYLLYSVDEENRFERVLLYDFFEDSLQGEVDYSSMRGLYIGDTFYLAGGSFVAAFDMNAGFEKTEVLKLA